MQCVRAGVPLCFRVASLQDWKSRASSNKGRAVERNGSRVHLMAEKGAGPQTPLLPRVRFSPIFFSP
eukprot:6074804-Pleurochrysis_carterae.AAC.2